jgi:protein-S-isoprenylcysteine O-methyltransferase Ste14
MPAVLLYAAAWAAFGAAHSLLARPAPKALLRRHCGRATRLVWNLIAALQLVLVLALARLIPAPPFDRPAWLVLAQMALALAGFAILFWSRRSYDLGRFLGTAQLTAPLDDDEPFSASGPLAYIRHPLYAGGLLLLAALVADARSAWTLLFATLYILIGLRFEERALLRRLGPDYARYRATVPALLPWRGRAWQEAG